MLQEVEFLFDNKLIEAVESLIKQARKSLLLVSPYIDLDPRIREALEEKKERPDFKLEILFGKNEKDFLKSIKQKSLDFLKTFPNVQIRYNSRLHAKYYQNESHYIMTSMNLFDYSLQHNIEAGVRSQYKGRGFLAKVADSAAGIVAEGVERVKQDLLGQAADTDPVQKFEKIFLTSDRMYETFPIFKEGGTLRSLIGSRTIEGYNVDLDNFTQIQVGAIGHDTAVIHKKVPMENCKPETARLNIIPGHNWLNRSAVS